MMRLLVFGWLLGALQAFGSEVTVTLLPTVTIAKEHATLAEVAELSGDAQLIARLAPLTIIDLPGLGEHLIDPRCIRQAIGPAGVGHLIVRGACRISRAVQLIDSDALIAAARATITAGDDELQVATVRPPSALAVPAGDAATTLMATPLDRASVGDIPFVIKALQGNHELGRALLTLHVDRFRTMSVANRIIRRGEIITALDVSAAKVPVRNGEQLIPATAIIGQAARLDLAARTPFTALNLQPVRCIRGGSPVTVRIQQQGFELTGSGTALADGDHGDTIQVRRSSDGQMITARVIGPGLVSPITN